MKRFALLLACVAMMAGSGCCCMGGYPWMGGGGCGSCGGYGGYGAGYTPGYAPAGGCPGGACGASPYGFQGAYMAPYGAGMTAALPPDYVVK
ncbi:MAG: hypothetical protein KDA58_02385 [Planctomycetaceae bacterium]|nr:hypothetical protein [Planctomycetaceae bacterium]